MSKVNSYFKEGKLYKFLSMLSREDNIKFGLNKGVTFLYLGKLPEPNDRPDARSVRKPCILLGSGLKIYFDVDSDFNTGPERYAELID